MKERKKKQNTVLMVVLLALALLACGPFGTPAPTLRPPPPTTPPEGGQPAPADVGLTPESPSPSSPAPGQPVPPGGGHTPGAPPPSSPTPEQPAPPGGGHTPGPQPTDPSQPGGDPGDGPGGSQGAVDFVNNTSYPIIFLEIDGVQQFPSSPQGILSGGSYRVNVGAGSHTFAAYNGWWEGDGSRFLMYNWTGSFTDQEGNVTFTDPSIQQLLTGFGSSGYYLADYWTGDPVAYHEAGFCFYADGSFVFYIDGARADQGTYGDVSRSSGVVTFYVTNSDGSERFDGLYLETEAKFSMENGPADWRVMEYIHKGAACP